MVGKFIHFFKVTWYVRNSFHVSSFYVFDPITLTCWVHSRSSVNEQVFGGFLKTPANINGFLLDIKTLDKDIFILKSGFNLFKLRGLRDTKHKLPQYFSIFSLSLDARQSILNMVLLIEKLPNLVYIFIRRIELFSWSWASGWSSGNA